jgi:hypothetical protein
MMSFLKGWRSMLYLLFAGLAFFFLYRIKKSIQANKSAKDLSGDNGLIAQLSAQYAVMFDNAFRAWGDPSWVSDWIGDGTDEEGLYEIAKQMQLNKVTFANVVFAYKTKFNRDLTTDLSSELTSAELAKFFSYLPTDIVKYDATRIS